MTITKDWAEKAVELIDRAVSISDAKIIPIQLRATLAQLQGFLHSAKYYDLDEIDPERKYSLPMEDETLQDLENLSIKKKKR